MQFNNQSEGRMAYTTSIISLEQNQISQYSASIIHKMKENCFDFAFNNYQTLILAKCSNYLNLFRLFRLNGQLKMLTKLKSTDHDRLSYKIEFMNKRDSFVCGGNGILKIWGAKRKQRWYVQKSIDTERVNSFQIGKNDDLIVSFAIDNKLRIWYEVGELEWQCFQVFNFKSSYGHYLSLNDSNNKIIITGPNKIQIQELVCFQGWDHYQTIGRINSVHSVCFISDDDFVSIRHQNNQEILNLYSYDKLVKKFIMLNESVLPIEFGRLCVNKLQYIKSQKLFVFTSYINERDLEQIAFIKISENGKIEVQNQFFQKVKLSTRGNFMSWKQKITSKHSNNTNQSSLIIGKYRTRI